MEQIVAFIIQYKYFALVPLAVFEGPLTGVAVGFLIYLGVLHFVPAYLILIFGDIIPDLVYYYIGRYASDSKFVEKYRANGGIIFRNLELIKKLWFHHPKKTMSITKFAYGLSTPLLISAGLVKFPYRRFVYYEFPISISQYLIYVAIGYFLGHSYYLAEQYLQIGPVIISVAAIAFAVGYFLFAKYMRRQMERIDKEEL